MSSYNNSRGYFDKKGNPDSISLLVEGSSKDKLSLQKKIEALLLCTGISFSVNTLGTKDDVLQQCVNSKIPEAKLYIVNGEVDSQYSYLKTLYAIKGCTLETINDNPEQQEKLKQIIIDKLNPMLQELEYIKANYHDNWDGEGAKAINEVVYNNCVRIAKECDSKILNHWHLDFNPNGEILFFANNNNGYIKVRGDNYFAFYLRNGDKYLRHENQSFSMKKIHNILKLWEVATYGKQC